MKSRDTVHLYRGPSSWSLLPTTDNNWRVTREVIYKETSVIVIIFANMNSSGNLFFSYWLSVHLPKLQYSHTSESYSWFLTDFHIVLEPENSGMFVHFLYDIFSTGSKAYKLNPSNQSYSGVAIRERKILGENNRHELNIFQISARQPGQTLILFPLYLKTSSWIFTLKVEFSCASSHHILNRWIVSLYSS